jgi:hypothetical protein
MQLEQLFYKLPLRFDTQRMAEEIAQAPEAAWRPHPTGYAGNTALLLVTANGGENDDMTGPKMPTPRLQHCPYLQQVMASFQTVIGRCRLMRLEPGARVNEHCDINYYWRQRIRLHIPIVTHPAVAFSSNGETVHMAAGEAWTFDNWYMHKVENPTDVRRVHLVIDTVGSASLWNLINASRDPGAEPRFVPFRPDETPSLAFERHTGLPVMTPGELDAALAALAEDTRRRGDNDPEALQTFLGLLHDLGHEWHSQWVMHGPDEAGWAGYRSLVMETAGKMEGLGSTLRVASNGLEAGSILKADLQAAFTADLRVGKQPRRRKRPLKVKFREPVFIVAAPRSGSTLLFETLAENRAFLTLGDESHQQFESIQALSPHHRGYDSNRLIAADATPEVVRELKENFFSDLRTADGTRYQELEDERRPGSIRFLEKTPKNALRIPFLHAMFPDARFIYLYRNPRDNISSLLDSWRSGRYVTYRDLPDWDGPDWSHLLIPGWEELSGAPLAEIVRQQWLVTNQIILDDLEALPEEQWTLVNYADLLNAPARVIEHLCNFANVPFGARMQEVVGKPLKNSKYTLTRPDPDKWRKNKDELKPVLEQVEPMIQRVMALHPEH